MQNIAVGHRGEEKKHSLAIAIPEVTLTSPLFLPKTHFDKMIRRLMSNCIAFPDRQKTKFKVVGCWPRSGLPKNEQAQELARLENQKQIALNSVSGLARIRPGLPETAPASLRKKISLPTNPQYDDRQTRENLAMFSDN